MSGSRTSWVVTGIIGGAVVVMIGMAGVLAAAFFWFAPQTRVVSAGPAPERIEEPVAVEAPVAEPEPEPKPEPEPGPEPRLEPEVEPEPEPEVETEAVVTSECVPNSKGITQLGPKKWRVKRSLIEKYTSSSSAASKLARVKWAKTKSGKNRGVRLTRVPCKSPLRAAGFQSKDVILEVDGKSVTSYAQGLRIWASIRRKGSFTVKIKRGKGTRTHRYYLQ